MFQAFRAWSVQQTYGQLTADVRAITASTPLYYYFGGGFGNATNYANNPDTFFQLAKQYNVTIIDDDASSQGLTLTFGSLARAYGVKVAQEWTAPPDNSQLAAKAVSWISLYAMGLPEGGGEDFFIHDGTEKDTVGFPIYTSWLPTLKGLSRDLPAAAGRRLRRLLPGLRQHQRRQPEQRGERDREPVAELPGRLHRRDQPGSQQRRGQAVPVQGGPAAERRRREPDRV